MKKVLLHICCGICALACIEKLKQEGFYVEGFFFNPNIHPFEEYQRRKQALKSPTSIFDIKIHEGLYSDKEWFMLCAPFAREPEGGLRCQHCYKIRLDVAYQFAREKNFDYFTTTLTISPHKNSDMVFNVGNEINPDKFLAIDFKKNNGFKRTQELSKVHNLYRQNYCGCIYSFNNRRT